MKRSELKRKKPLARKRRLRQRDAKRLRKLQEKQFGDHATYIRSLPCCACNRCPPSEPAHVKSRGAGGTAKDLVPMCAYHHRKQHGLGIATFQRLYQIDLRGLADQLWEGRDALVHS